MNFDPELLQRILSTPAKAIVPPIPRQHPVPAPSLSLFEALARIGIAPPRTVSVPADTFPGITALRHSVPSPPPKTKTQLVPSVAVCDGLLKSLLAKRQIAITEGRVLPSLDDLAVGSGRQLKAAFVYSDLAGFSKVVASQPRDVSLSLMMSFVDLMSWITTYYGGTLVDCAGDRTLSVFHRPSTDFSPEPARTAVTCALWMQTIVQRVLAPAFAKLQLPGISVGIGVDYGDAVVGCVGVRGNKRFVFLGDPANNAAKLQEMTGANETVLSYEAFTRRQSFMDARCNWFFFPEVDTSGQGIYRTQCRFADSVVNPPPA